MGVRLVILDRDGVINIESDKFVRSAAEWQPIEGSLEGIRILCDAGFTIAVASNQSGLGRGLFGRAALEEMHRKMCRLVGEAGGTIDHIVICPHQPADYCSCRKPKPGLYLRLADYYKISLHGVPIIGDSARDIEAALAVGGRAILVLTGNGPKARTSLSGCHYELYPDLLAAAHSLAGERA